MEKLKILVVGGHPADIFDSAGGTLLKHSKQGDEVTGLVITQGGRVHDVVVANIRTKEEMLGKEEMEKLLKERSAVKQKEVRKACKMLGFKEVRFLYFEDIVLMLKEEIIRKVAATIRELQPHIVMTHFPYDNGGIADHHAITGQIVLNALWAAGSIDTDDPNPPAKIAQVFFFAIPSQILKHTLLYSYFPCYATVYVDVTDCMELKIKALSTLASQNYSLDYALKAAETVKGSLGWSVSLPYAEAFLPYLPEIYESLPVSKFRLEHRGEKEPEVFKRVNVMVTRQKKFSY